ncbi:MAG: hypothetical protein H7Y02_09230 [Candidatus Obscuribacterales bacterium]|nr:hypothetical protein [Steroidobacteraceae bacterium]
MSTVFSSPPVGATVNPAANEDHVGERIVVTSLAAASRQGWDAYDVWRRLIRDARDRREGRDVSRTP